MILLVAAAAAIAFNPPLARPVLYETEQSRIVDGATQRYRMVNSLAFARDGAGWRATLTLVDLSTDARTDRAALFDAGMRPFLDVPVTLRLDADGRPRAVENGAAAWARIVDTLRRLADQMAARNGGEGEVVRALRGWVAEMAALDAPARDAKLMEAADALIGFDLPALAPGASAPWRDAGGTGTITALVSGGYRIAVKADALADETEFALDPATGLLARSRSVKRLGARVLAEETIRRLR